MSVIEIEYSGEVNRGKFQELLWKKYPELSGKKIKYSTTEAGHPVIRIKSEMDQDGIRSLLENCLVEKKEDVVFEEEIEKPIEKEESEVSLMPEEKDLSFAEYMMKGAKKLENDFKLNLEAITKTAVQKGLKIDKVLEDIARDLKEKSESLDQFIVEKVDANNKELVAKLEKVSRDLKDYINELVSKIESRVGDLEGWRKKIEGKIEQTKKIGNNSSEVSR